MTPSMTTEVIRSELQQQLFPNGIPQLWCPLITHFQSSREADGERTLAHFRSIAPHVKGILVPGSTGEGWQMSDDDIFRQLSLILPIADRFQTRVLIGVLKTNIDEMLTTIKSMQSYLEHRAVVGITICPPKGKGLSQQSICDGLGSILELGHPTALYQLPQVTENEMDPETVARLAARFANFILFKDTSGKDRVAQSKLDLSNVFLVRGSEQGGYSSWPRGAGGCYDGFLLSTANVAAPKLKQILDCIETMELDRANAISIQLQKLIEKAFSLAADCPQGNPFANANKAIDHFLAYGERASDFPAPMLLTGDRIPSDLMKRFESLLASHGWIPKDGYMTEKSQSI